MINSKLNRLHCRRDYALGYYGRFTARMAASDFAAIVGLPRLAYRLDDVQRRNDRAIRGLIEAGRI